MKSMIKILLLSFLIGITAFGCRKDTVIVPQHNSNITLYNKPLNIIKANIMGKWKLIYSEASSDPAHPNDVRYYQDSYTEFTSNGNRRIDTFKDSIVLNASINWVKASGSQVTYVPYGTTTYLMTYQNKYSAPYDFVVDSIYNDTLILHLNAGESWWDHFVRVNQ